MHLLMLLIIGLTWPRDLTSKPSTAHCLEFVAASPEGGWLQVRNVCREAVRGSLAADFGYCDFDVGCFDGGDVMVKPGACETLVIDEGEAVIGELCALGIQLSVDGEAGNVLLVGDEDVIDGLWHRMPDDGPQPC